VGNAAACVGGGRGSVGSAGNNRIRRHGRGRSRPVHRLGAHHGSLASAAACRCQIQGELCNGEGGCSSVGTCRAAWPRQNARAASMDVRTCSSVSLDGVRCCIRASQALALEQFLSAELGATIEMQGQPKPISVMRLRDLFVSVLRTSSLDETWSAEKQVEVMLAG